MSNPAASPSPNWFGRNRRLLLIGGPAVVLAVALVFYLMTGRYVSTDDAYIQAARVDISTEVSGRIAEIDVRDNQLVHKGEVLFRLDTPSFNIAVADARAQLAAAMIKVPSLQAAYRQRLADEAGASSTLDYAQRELARQTELQAQGISSRAQLDQAKNNFQSAQQQLAAAQQQTASALAGFGRRCRCPLRQPSPGAPGASGTRHAPTCNCPIPSCMRRWTASLPRWTRSRWAIMSNAATPLFALMSNSDLWVEANFKETDLTYMRPGQRATFYRRCLSGAHLHRPCPQHQPRHWVQLLAAAAGKFFGQLGEGGAAPARPAFHRQ